MRRAVHEGLLPQSGQTIVEVTVVIALIGMVLVGMLSTSTFSVQVTRQSNNRATALKLAQDTIDYIRAERDTSWTTVAARTDGTTSPVVYCVSSNDDGTISGLVLRSSTCPQDSNLFIREVTLRANAASNANRINVTSQVSWQEKTNGVFREATLYSIITKR